MKRGLLYVLMFTMLISSCAEKKAVENVKYFSKLTGIISPFLDYKPRGELAETELMGRCYYKVYYDDANRIKEIQYFRDSIPDDQSYFYAHKVKYAYEPDHIVRFYFDA